MCADHSDPSALPRLGTSRIASHGLSIVQEIVERNLAGGGLGYLFRPVPTHDFGIDAQIEAVAEDNDGELHPTGKIISLQIKSGDSYFQHDEGYSWRVYISKQTVRYWQSHSVPVLLVLVDEESGLAYWVRGDAEWTETDANFCIRVPKTNLLGASCVDTLADIAENQTLAGSRLAVLESSGSWIDAASRSDLEDGRCEIEVEICEWVNKSSGRADVCVTYSVSPDEADKPGEGPSFTERQVEDRFSYLGVSDIWAFLDHLFPWAEATQSLDDYDLYAQYEADTGIWDSEDQRYYRTSDESYSDWLDRQKDSDGLVNVNNDNGEVRTLSFQLELNELGRSYLVLRRFLYPGDEDA